MAIARTPVLVIDCAEPGELAAFYAGLLGWETAVDDDGSWAEALGDGTAISFQRVEGFQPPAWPGQEHPQQMHLDVTVDDIEAATPEAVALGARVHDEQPSEDGGFRVLLDPAGHPLCLCRPVA